MATLYVDGYPFEVDPHRNLLEVCLELGFDVPYFCWHPALGSVGACRQCAVKQFKDEHDSRGKIVMACMTPAADGTRISIDDPEAVEFRARVIEWLMLNHPHDCPVCDEGGECHLQDMTVMTGHAYRRTRFPKRTHRNQYLGPLVNHEMNRCIQCYRCVRFYRDYAGGRDFDVFAAHDAVYFGRHAPGVLENGFAGNLVEVCPTGVFTDKTLKRHYTRKWDLTFSPSICPHCGVGCNVSPAARYGTVRRVVNRYHHELNGYFICDRGRYGYEFTTQDTRLRVPAGRRFSSGSSSVTAEQALAEAARLLRACSRLIGIGSARASLESNYALRRLVGAENFSTGLPRDRDTLVRTALQILRTGPAPAASPRDAECSDAVLVLGEDLPHTAPRVALSLRQAATREPRRIAHRLGIPDWHDQAVRNLVGRDRGPVFIATPDRTELDEVARRVLRAAPDGIARLGFAVAHEIDSEAPSVSELEPSVRSLAAEMARALVAARRPLVVSGTSLGSLSTLQAAANVAWALCRAGRPARILLSAPECNAMGVVMLGDKSLDSLLGFLHPDETVGAIVLENDLSRHLSAPGLREFLDRVSVLVAIDCVSTETTQRADIALPAAAFTESDGTLVNYEARAQRFFSTLPAPSPVQASWRWLAELDAAFGAERGSSWSVLDEVIAALGRDFPELGVVADAAPPASARYISQKIPREPARYSGRTAIDARRNVSEPKPPDDADSPLSRTMEGYPLEPPPASIAYFWAPGWNSYQAVNKYQQEIGGRLRGGPPGVSLMSVRSDARPAYFADGIPARFSRSGSEVLVLGAHHLFGSEELSSLAPAIAELAPKPYLTLSAKDFAELGVAPGRELELALPEATFTVPVYPGAALPAGVALLPVGLRQLPWLGLPVLATIKGEA